ncbi:response regulator [Mariprofundus ferrooxydans]|uniref:histidine kinase n=1 Tax=Mariprofundus ferrooxydans PV-1 TaxID=314345 RepID=Q0F1Y2_9PROT|nr:response regulator [Mariprofundus ferrooxydans]EAU55768.1 Two component system histidine kinase [Mariprofundus ferrooxydans PV-1]KON47920.1 histidine kinase [Mariprofundus ferrooxydans]
MSSNIFRIAIIGAGRGGEALLQVLQEDSDIRIVAIVDARVDAPALKQAALLSIPILHAVEGIPACDMVINVTGCSDVSERLCRYFSSDVEIMEGKAARFFYDQMCKRKAEKKQIEQMLAEFEQLNRIGRHLNTTDSLSRMLKLVLQEAMQVTGSPAGTVSLYDKRSRSLSLYAASGFSDSFGHQDRWVIREGGLTERIFSERKPFVVPDIADSEELALNSMLAEEGVQALVAVPLALGTETVGILYVNDFAPREYDENHLCILDLLANQAAHAIQKARLFETIEQEKAELKSLNEHLEARIMERTADLTSANEALTRANQAKSQFISNMSHELRTPLTSINGFSEFLIDGFVGPLNETQTKYLKNINISGKHLLELINGILDLAKIEAGKMTLKLEKVDVAALLDEILLVLQGYATKTSVRLLLECDAAIPGIVLDRTKFKQILYNLCSNAIKFSPQGGEVRIVVDYNNSAAGQHNDDELESYARLTVAIHDEGIGISPEDQVHIFNPFEQADGSHSRNYEGTGLGLTLTQRLVEMHGGSIEVNSAPDKGSCFVFTLPVEFMQKAPVEKTIMPADKPELLLQPMHNKPLAVEPDAPVIMVVDDDAHSLEISTLYLSDAGYRVCHAMNGDDALLVARKKRPFLILLDVMMPGKDGWEVLQELKIDADTSDIPVIMCTVSENEELGIALGATDYLSKPINRELLASKLKTLSKGIHRRHRAMHVLAIDDDESIRELYTATLTAQGYRVHTAGNGPDGISLAESVEPDIIILDLMMPGMDGFEVAERLKRQPRTQNIPIIVVTARELAVAERVRLMGHIEECVSKEQFTRERLIDEIRQIESIYPYQAGLKDNISGLLNHRYYQIRLNQEISRASRNSEKMACVVFDLDGFSRFSEMAGDAYVHSALRKVGSFMMNNLRGSDIATRHRVDEFAMILTRTELEGALLVVNRLKNMIETYPFPGEEGLDKPGLTTSAAISLYPVDGDTPEKLITACHERIHKAKASGRNKLAYEKNGGLVII